MLLNENRIRVPQVTGAPVTGTTTGQRGDMMMIETEGDVKLYICLNTGLVDTPATLTVAGADADGGVIYTAIDNTVAGNSITVDHVVAGTGTAFSVVVTGTDIVVNSATDGGGLATTTAADVVAGIIASAEASALVTAVATGTGLGLVVAGAGATALAGGGDNDAVWSSVDMTAI